MTQNGEGPVRIWRGGPVATCAAQSSGLGLIEDGAVVAQGESLAYVGAADAIPEALLSRAGEITELGGRLVTPGLIDCHTHLVFAGDRSDEWRQKLAGVPYTDIARSGGGIAASVRATRAADEAELVRLALPRLDGLLADGVTTVEIKSGYGLSIEDELKMLRAARRLQGERPFRLKTTLLSAHALPPEYREDRVGYLDLIIQEILPRAAAEGLVDAVDAFCETIAFTTDETARVFQAAGDLGLRVKLHADQLSDSGGAELAARFHALSADHLEWTSEEGLAALAAAGTTPVLLPGAFYVLKEEQKPPVAAMRALGLEMAVASDLNPGTSPVASLRLALHLACTLFGLTLEEALIGATRAAARALGEGDRLGQLRPGFACDLAIWEASNPAEIVYWLGRAPAATRVIGGVCVLRDGPEGPPQHDDRGEITI